MISENCKYSYYDMKLEDNTCKFEIGIEKAIELFNTARIKRIVGYSNGVVIVTYSTIQNFGDITANTYFMPWSPEMIQGLFSTNEGLADIINSHLGRKAETAEQAHIYFMAKVLGQHEI